MVQFIPRFTNIDYLHCHGFISYQHAALTAQMKSNYDQIMKSNYEIKLSLGHCQ